MKLQLLCLLLLAAVCGSASAAEAFDGLTCSSDIVTALKGRHIPDGPAAATRAAHQDIALKDLGSDELDWGSAIWWKICGTTYMAIADQKAIIRDVIKLASRPGATLAFDGICKGGPKDKEVVAIVEDKAGATDLPVQAAWIIDDARKRFAPLPAAGLLCPRGDGIVDSWNRSEAP